MLQSELNEIVVKHRKWLLAEEGGSRADLTGADLAGAVLTDADLTGADLRGAVLRGAILRDADLTGADLAGAVLRDADLTGADLTGADLTDADLTDADLTGADLTGADLTDADLRDADLTGAVLTDAVLTDADLRGAVLRGAIGVPDEVKSLRKLIADTVLANPQSLEMNSWHGQNACGTTHCIAGWACHLAPNGRWIESQLGTASAARFLLGLLDKGQDEVFFTGNSEAMEVLKRWSQEPEVANA